MHGHMPTEDQAGVYPATLAFLRAVRDAKAIEGEAVVEAMRRAPVNDPLFGRVTIRADGRAVHDMHRFRVKRPSESRGRFDDCAYVSTIPAAVAFRPLDAGGCRLVQ